MARKPKPTQPGSFTATEIRENADLHIVTIAEDRDRSVGEPIAIEVYEYEGDIVLIYRIGALEVVYLDADSHLRA